MDNYFKKLMRLSDKLDQDTTIDIEHKASYNRMAKIVEKNQAPLPDSTLGPKKLKSKPTAPKNMGLVSTLAFINEFPDEHSSSHRMDWYNSILATTSPPQPLTLQGHLDLLKKEEFQVLDFSPLTLSDLTQLKSHAGTPQAPNAPPETQPQPKPPKKFMQDFREKQFSDLQKIQPDTLNAVDLTYNRALEFVDHNLTRDDLVGKGKKGNKKVALDFDPGAMARGGLQMDLVGGNVPESLLYKEVNNYYQEQYGGGLELGPNAEEEAGLLGKYMKDFEEKKLEFNLYEGNTKMSQTDYVLKKKLRYEWYDESGTLGYEEERASPERQVRGGVNMGNVSGKGQVSFTKNSGTDPMHCGGNYDDYDDYDGGPSNQVLYREEWADSNKLSGTRPMVMFQELLLDPVSSEYWGAGVSKLARRIDLMDNMAKARVVSEKADTKVISSPSRSKLVGDLERSVEDRKLEVRDGPRRIPGNKDRFEEMIEYSYGEGSDVGRVKQDMRGRGKRAQEE